MKILITTDWYAPVINGVVTSVVNLENELRKNGHEVKVLTLSPNHYSHIKGNVTYIGSFSAGIIYPNARMKISFRNRYILELIKWKPDIIHSQCEFSTFLFAKKIAGCLDIPIVHTYHTVYEDYTKYFSPNRKLGRKAVVRFSKWISGHCERMIAPTEKVKEMLNSYNISCPTEVIPTGIELNKFYMSDKKDCESIRRNLNIKKDDFTAVYVGRLAKEKNIEELIKIHSQIKNPNVKLLIVGDGPHRKELERFASEKGLSERVIFSGMVSPDKVAQYYKCGDIFVSASTSETQGLTYIEALASGLPVICRKDKCLDNVIENAVNGLQYTSFDEYVNVVRELASNREALRSMSGNALTSSRKFSCEVFAEKAEQLYKEAVISYQKQALGLTAG